MMDKPKIVAVVGPTASGKTALAVSLAAAFHGEVISCDSMQIYRGMDIGTAKPEPEEQAGIPHHMIDVVFPDMDYSCADYAKEAGRCVSEILRRGNLPLFCGGTGLYLDAVCNGGQFAPDVDPAIRQSLMAYPPQELYRMLAEADPESAAAIHPNNVKRVMRALEIFKGTGRTKSEWDKRSKTAEKPYDALILGLNYRDRSALYGRIDQRVDQMLQNGLCEEVRKLDLCRNSTAAQAIGYKELYEWLDGGKTYEEAVAALKQNTRNYAKRQLTWFRRNPDIVWIYPDDELSENREKRVFDAACKAVRKFLGNRE